MCDGRYDTPERRSARTVPLSEAVGMVLAHDITEIRKEEFKGPAFRKGHVIQADDVCHLRRLGKERIFILSLSEDEMHEDKAALALAYALMGEGVSTEGKPREGKVSIVAARDGLLQVNTDALYRFNMLGEVMCATLHDNTVVRKGRTVAETRAIPLVIGRDTVKEAVSQAEEAGGVVEVKQMLTPRAGVVITGNEVFSGRVEDAFAPVIRKKIEGFGGTVVEVSYAPDDEALIEERLRKFLEAGANLLITTGGMSVDPDDVTRFAIRKLGARDITYGSPVLPGAMFLVAYLEHGQNGTSSPVPVLGIPACGMYHTTTVLDLVLPRILAGERIGRAELAALGHGGLCLHCGECRYPVCPLGK